MASADPTSNRPPPDQPRDLSGRPRQGRPYKAFAAIAALALLVASCGHLRYYGQAVGGGLGLLLDREPIEKVLAREDLTEQDRERLELALEIRRFASERLELPENKSYRSYVEIDRPYVVWNVVAAPALSTEPRTWCFPIAGCVSYRGYFSHRRAQRFAQRLEQRGMDVSIGGVTAYSTLGWFADPVLSTFLHEPERRLAALLFHELAHQVAYAPGDTTFNESFATVVETEGLRLYLAERGQSSELEVFLDEQRQERVFVDLVLSYRDRLAAVYQDTALSDATKLDKKGDLIADLEKTYMALPQHPYSTFFERDINNADLASMGAYYQLTEPIQNLLESEGGDLGAFYDRVRELAELGYAERREALEPESASATLSVLERSLSRSD